MDGKKLGIADETDDVNAYVDLLLSRFGRLDPTSIHSSDGASQALQRVDRELAALKTAMRRVLPQRNALVPIARLPPEVLALVFKVLSIDCPPAGNSYSIPFQKLGWINVSHVSQRWRRVALENPSLWSGLVLTLGDDWLDESLSRVKEAALHLNTVDTPYSSLPSTNVNQLERILKHPRIAEVRIRRVSHNSTHVEQFLSLPAPFLHTLELVGNDDGLARRAFVVPSTLFAQNAPNLRRVVLERCNCVWSTLQNFRGLTELVLKRNQPNVYNGTPRSSTWSDFVHCIGQMPGLEVLAAEHSIPHIPSDFVPESARISLLQLSTLSLRGDVRDCLGCLRTIEHPSFTKITVVCPSRSSTVDNDAQLLLALLKPHMIAFATSVGPPLSVTITDKDGLSIAFLDYVERHVINLKPKSPVFWMELEFKAHERYAGHSGLSQSMDALDFMRDEAFSSAVLRKLKSVHVEGWGTLWTPEIFMNMFGRCQEVQRLALASYAALPASKALSLPNPHAPPPPAPEGKPKTKKQAISFLFPDLQTLSLRHTEFDARQQYGKEKGIFRTLFLRWLKARLAKEAGPKALVIGLCTVRPVDVDKLKALVPEVLWDEEEESTGSEAQMDVETWAMMNDFDSAVDSHSDSIIFSDDYDLGPPFAMLEELLAMAAGAL
ncbi:hypothetical protein OF83DRAFT_1087511 [Amylostereum chailletii]|nr:hypothetical protein OF83DRAFT_1087511 [Amylostereum chailletii]